MNNPIPLDLAARVCDAYYGTCGRSFNEDMQAALAAHLPELAALLAVRDHALAAHECPTVPVWRPVIDGEDLTGYEVRARGREVDMWHAWGVAARRRNEGFWVTEGGWLLTGWPVVETTAPLPAPEPWHEELVGVVSDALAGDEDPGPHWDDDARRVLDALAARGYLERPKAGA